MNKLLPTLQSHDNLKGDPKRVGRFGTKHGGRNLNDEIAAGLTSSVEAPHASRQVVPDFAKARQTPASSGRKLFARWKLRNPGGSYSKTRLVSSLLTAAWNTKVSSIVWRERVIGSRVLLYLHQRSARGIDEIESGLLPTMKSSPSGGPDFARASREGSGGNDLVTALALIPTLTEACATGGQMSRSGKRKNELLLGGLIATITARDHRSEKCSPETFEKNSRPLSETIWQCTGYRLSSSFAEWFMGFPPGWTDIDESESRLSETALSPRSQSES